MGKRRIRLRGQKAKKARKKMETSKVLLIISDTLAFITVILTFRAVFVTEDLSPLMVLIPGVFGLVSVAHGFYFWKAKAENLKKIGLADKITMQDSSGSGCGTESEDFYG